MEIKNENTLFNKVFVERKDKASYKKISIETKAELLKTYNKVNLYFK